MSSVVGSESSPHTAEQTPTQSNLPRETEPLPIANTHPAPLTYSKYLINNIPRAATPADLLEFLLAISGSDQSDGPFDPAGIPGVIMTESRLDDELNVAMVEFIDTPEWLEELNHDPCGFPKQTPLGTIWRGVDANAVDQHGQSKFIRAVIEGNQNLHCAEMLAEFGTTNVNIQDKRGRTALHWACEGGQLEMIMMCLSVRECDVGLKDDDGLTAFDLAMRETGGNEVISTLFYKSVFELEEVNPQAALLRILTLSSESAKDKPLFPGKAIFEPIQDRNKPLVEALINRGIDTTATNQDGDTALHVAAKTGDMEIVTILLKAGFEVNAIGNGGATPLHYAVNCADRKMIKVLLESGADITVKDTGGWTALQLEEQRGLVAQLERLAIAETPEAAVHASLGDIESRNENGFTALQQAVQDRELKTVRVLLGLGANKEAVDKNRQTALHLAAANGYLKIVKALVAGGANVNAIGHGRWTPLRLATNGGHVKIVNTLLAAGARVIKVGTYENTALHLAAEGGHLEIAKKLLTHGAQPHTQKAGGITALHLAAEKGHLDMVLAFLANTTEIDLRDNEGDAALHLAVERGHLEIARALLAAGADLELRDSWGNTALHLAALNGHEDTLEMLLAHGAQIEATVVAETATHTGQVGHDTGATAIHLAVKGGYLPVVRSLLASGAQVNGIGTYKNTALNLAVEVGQLELVQRLLAGGAQVNRVGSGGNTALHLAAKNGHLEIVQALLAAGADLEAIELERRPTVVVGKKGRMEKLKTILTTDSANFKGTTALHQAAENGHQEIVHTLLTAGAQIQATDRRGNSALHLAAENGHLETIKTLLTGGANLEAMALGKIQRLMLVRGQLEKSTTFLAGSVARDPGNTALHVAAENGHPEIVQALLGSGAKIEAMGPEGTALHLAAENGQMEVVEALQACGARIKAECLQGAPLRLAARNGQVEIVKALLAGGAQTEAADVWGRTALHLAAERGYMDVGRELLDCGANMETTSTDGWTSLHHAAWGGQLDFAQLLMFRGAERQPKDTKRRTPLKVAKICGQDHLVSMLK